MEDFCEVSGLTVRVEDTTDSLFKWTVNEGLPYRTAYDTNITVYTNVDTGKSATEVGADTEEILSVTNNGDGTLTLTQLQVHNHEFYSEDGSLIGQTDGRTTTERVFDHGGTPSDPYDDVDVNDHVREIDSTVNGDDFCTVMVEEIG